MNTYLLILASTSLFISIFLFLYANFEGLRIRIATTQKANDLLERIEAAEARRNFELADALDDELYELTNGDYVDDSSNEKGSIQYLLTFLIKKLFQYYVIFMIVASSAVNPVFGYLMILAMVVQAVIFFNLFKNRKRINNNFNEYLSKASSERIMNMVTAIEILINIYILYTILDLLGVLK